MTTNDWIALTPDQFHKFQSSKHNRLLCSKAPKPEPPPATIKDGEQCCNLVVHDVFESFDAGEFEATMICSNKPSPCMNEEETTKDDGIIKALEIVIVFFETFCLLDDFEAHAMDDETNIPGTTNKSLKPSSLPCLSLQTKSLTIPPMNWL
jgi:hypothetical protein